MGCPSEMQAHPQLWLEERREGTNVSSFSLSSTWLLAPVTMMRIVPLVQMWLRVGAEYLLPRPHPHPHHLPAKFCQIQATLTLTPTQQSLSH